jgi:chloride channel 7
MAYLNGIKVPRILHLKTLIVNTVGVIFSVSGGLAVGKEGPLIQAGCAIGGGISQGKSPTTGFDTGLFKAFRNDRDKRDFVSAGAAAGMGVVFGAPIGGLLFSLEEGATSWNQMLTWRIFFCAMTATFFLNVFRSAYMESVDDLSHPGLISFGSFPSTPYRLFEIPIFLAIGVVGGLLGAFFNAVHARIAELRQNVLSRYWRFAEVFIVSLATSAVAFLLVYLFDLCLPTGDTPVASSPVLFFCPEQQYNQMASVLFATPEETIVNLFHLPAGDYSMSLLAAFAFVYFGLTCWTFGVNVPAGIFLPVLLSGAALGRLCGEIIYSQADDPSWVDPGKYALIGAAALMAGTSRMTISITVIILEATGSVALGLPLMLTVLAAKWTGDRLVDGLFDVLVRLRRFPILGFEPPPEMRHFRAVDVMCTRLDCFQLVDSVGNIVQVLRRSQHNAFPVVVRELPPQLSGDGSAGTFYGMILRSQLVTLLKRRAFGTLIHTGGSLINASVQAPRVAQEAFEAEYPRYPTLESVELDESDMNQFVDLRLYANPATYTVRESATLTRAFRLFRSMGLRHLVVVNRFNQVLGMITRQDLIKYRMVHGFLNTGRFGFRREGWKLVGDDDDEDDVSLRR